MREKAVHSPLKPSWNEVSTCKVNTHRQTQKTKSKLSSATYIQWVPKIGCIVVCLSVNFKATATTLVPRLLLLGLNPSQEPGNEASYQPVHLCA